VVTLSLWSIVTRLNEAQLTQRYLTADLAAFVADDYPFVGGRKMAYILYRCNDLHNLLDTVLQVSILMFTVFSLKC